MIHERIYCLKIIYNDYQGKRLEKHPSATSKCAKLPEPKLDMSLQPRQYQKDARHPAVAASMVASSDRECSPKSGIKGV